MFTPNSVPSSGSSAIFVLVLTSMRPETQVAQGSPPGSQILATFAQSFSEPLVYDEVKAERLWGRECLWRRSCHKPKIAKRNDKRKGLQWHQSYETMVDLGERPGDPNPPPPPPLYFKPKPRSFGPRYRDISIHEEKQVECSRASRPTYLSEGLDSALGLDLKCPSFILKS